MNRQLPRPKKWILNKKKISKKILTVKTQLRNDKIIITILKASPAL
jgi:hypothetical protein